MRYKASKKWESPSYNDTSARIYEMVPYAAEYGASICTEICTLAKKPMNSKYVLVSSDILTTMLTWHKYKCKQCK